jgi:hypothetical protein
MIFSRGVGPQEGATLAIASSAKEAKRLAWKRSGLDFDDFTDLGILRLWDAGKVLPLANQEKLKAGIPHIVDDPVSCQVCHYWGAGLTSEGLCGNCNSYPGDKLVSLLGKAVSQ